MAGTNDVSYNSSNNSQADPEEIVERIVSIGRNARKHGATNIFVNSIINRKGYFYNRIMNKINLLLRLKCRSENFYFIDNSNIDYSYDLIDGLHLNDKGNRTFINNLLNCFDSYNPYLLDEETYENLYGE